MIFFGPKAIVALCFICFFGCSSIEEQIEGRFIFEFPSGEFQILSILSDNTFTQEIYYSREDYTIGISPKFENSGRWMNDRNDITFVHWLSYCEYRDPKQLRKQPIKITMANVYFSNSMIGSKDYLSIHMENGYVFKRMEEKK